MTDRPIIFSAPMVRALLDGRKTQTRRIIKQPRFEAQGCHDAQMGGKHLWFDYWSSDHAEVHRIKLPYAPGDRLWVREAWRAERGQDRQTATEIAAACLDAGYSRVWCPTFYEVDGERVNFENGMVAGRYRHARFMPRWASRLTLTVTEVRVQRLQEISEDDAVAEGIQRLKSGRGFYDPTVSHAAVRFGEWTSTARQGFSRLWNHIHGPDAWAENPWVVALTFTVARGNIDGAAP